MPAELQASAAYCCSRGWRCVGLQANAVVVRVQSLLLLAHDVQILLPLHRPCGDASVFHITGAGYDNWLALSHGGIDDMMQTM
jgi:hypothetical protein